MSDAPAPTRAEEGREIIAELERELGVTGTANVFRKALAIAKEACRTGEHSGFSGAGVQTVIGSRKDIDLVQRWCQEAATIPYLQDRIKSAEAEVARLTAALAEAERERDEAKSDEESAWRDKEAAICAVSRRCLDLEASASALRERVATLEAALRFYADDENYRMHGLCNPENSYFTGPNTARTALEAPHADN